MHVDTRQGVEAGVAATLAGLLLEARRALPDDPDVAERMIALAVDMLHQRPALQERDAPSAGGLAPWQMSRLRSIIEARIAERLSTARLAEVVRLSPSHFARAFARSFGRSPHSFVMERRVERAKSLMMTTNDTLSSIALTCGFADQAHFSRLFRKVVGEPPFAWRRAQSAMTSMCA